MKLRRTIITLIIILIISGIIIAILLVQPYITGRVIKNQIQEYTYTKAICNKTKFCQDNLITCKGKDIVSIKPITGAVVQHSEDWQDPRDKEIANKLC